MSCIQASLDAAVADANIDADGDAGVCTLIKQENNRLERKSHAFNCCLLYPPPSGTQLSDSIRMSPSQRIEWQGLTIRQLDIQMVGILTPRGSAQFC